jgi:RNase adapter protein RapZ
MARPVRVVIVTGVSGAGKSTALRALEDLDFFCVDNLPVPLIASFVELLGSREPKAGEHQVPQAAIVVDARAGAFLPEHRKAVKALRDAGHFIEVLYLDASEEVLVRRFSETRRRHPLSGDDLRDGIRREREMLKALREDAEALVDTGNLNVHQLKGVIQERYRRSAEKLSVTLLSFGFRHGLPVEADFVFDVRSLPNPYFVEELSAGTGEDAAVAAFVFAKPTARSLVDKIIALLDEVIPLVEDEGKAYLTIAVGCTGGRHRSVAVVRELQKRVRGGKAFAVRHRDLERRGRD